MEAGLEFGGTTTGGQSSGGSDAADSSFFINLMVAEIIQATGESYIIIAL